MYSVYLSSKVVKAGFALRRLSITLRTLTRCSILGDRVGRGFESLGVGKSAVSSLLFIPPGKNHRFLRVVGAMLYPLNQAHYQRTCILG